MRFGKFLLGAGTVVGGIILAPVVAPVAAAAGAAALATAGTAAATVGTAVASTTLGSAVIGGAAAVGAATTAATTAVASSAVGVAVGTGMAAVGSTVGTVAGAVGLSSVATVAGTTAGATAVGVITTSGVVGAGSAVSGAGKMSKASKIADEAQKLYENSRVQFDKVEAETNKLLEELGRKKVIIWDRFNEFEKLFNKIQNLNIAGEAKIEKALQLNVNKLQQVHVLAVSAKSVIKDGVVSMTSGQLIGAASATGITSVATASTGTAIASLHGAAAYNASMAALGGGALNAGGLGMAGGAAVANVMAFAPAVAVGGLFINIKGNKSLKNAEESLEEAEKLSNDMKFAETKLREIQKLCRDLSDVLMNYKTIFGKLLVWLQELTDRECNAEFYTEEEKTKCYASYRVVEILYDLTTIELYSTENEKTVVHSEKVKKVIKDSDTEWDKYRKVI